MYSYIAPQLRYGPLTLNIKICYKSQNHSSVKILILTFYHVPKLRYSAHAGQYKPLLHCIESLKHNSIETCFLKMADEHKC